MNSYPDEIRVACHVLEAKVTQFTLKKPKFQTDISSKPALSIIIGRLARQPDTPLALPPSPLDIPPRPAKPTHPKLFTIKSREDFRNRKLRWIVPDILPAGPSVCAIFGPSGCGKSFLAMDMAAAIAAGETWFNRQCLQTPVIYACLEGLGGLNARLTALEQKRPIPACMGFFDESFDLIADVKRLAASAPANGVIFIDTLAAASVEVDENSSEMKKITASALEIAKTASCCVVLIHHTGKDREKGLRGHSSLKGALDAAIEVGKGKEGSRWWTVEKAKEAMETGEKITFTLEACGASAYVEENEIRKSYNKPKNMALECLLSTGQDLVSDKVWRRAFYALVEGSQDTKKKTYARAKSELLKKGVVEEVGEGIFKAT